MDFISTHAYPTDPSFDQSNQLDSFIEGLYNAYEASVGNPQVNTKNIPYPMYLSEFNSGLYSLSFCFCVCLCVKVSVVKVQRRNKDVAIFLVTSTLFLFSPRILSQIVWLISEN